MKRLALVLGILALLVIPAAALAGYGYPSSGPSMGGGGGNAGGGSSGGGITVGGYPSSGPSMGGAAPSRGSSGDVTIVDFAFQPASISVPAGSTVTWNNTGGATHTVTAFNGAFDSGNLSPGGSFSETFSNPGVYMYHCTIHHNMVGTVMVTAS
jgi:plastocyanin